MRSTAFAAGIALALSACSAGEEAPVQPEATSTVQDPAPEPEPEPEPEPQPTSAPTSSETAQGGATKRGCTTVSTGGHYVGEGLTKRWVPGPKLEICDPLAPLPPAPYATVPPPLAPVATIPPPPVPNIVATRAD